MTEALATQDGLDRVLAFMVPGRNMRGRIVRLGPVLDEILAAHAYPVAIKHLLSEALVLTAMIGTLTKEKGGQLTLQAQAEGGAVDLLVCDFRDGELRGYARHDPEKLTHVGASPSLQALFGEGYLAITIELGSDSKRYQGIVPLEGASLSQACEAYFGQSEQVPSLIRAGVSTGPSASLAGALLLQYVPEGEVGRERLHVRDDHPDWEHVVALGSSIRHKELIEPQLPLDDIVWRLFHEEEQIRVEPLETLTRGCRCTTEHYRDVLSRFPASELDEMRNENGLIDVDCAFCSRILSVEV